MIKDRLQSLLPANVRDLLVEQHEKLGAEDFARRIDIQINTQKVNTEYQVPRYREHVRAVSTSESKPDTKPKKDITKNMTDKERNWVKQEFSKLRRKHRSDPKTKSGCWLCGKEGHKMETCRQKYQLARKAIEKHSRKPL